MVVCVLVGFDSVFVSVLNTLSMPLAVNTSDLLPNQQPVLNRKMSDCTQSSRRRNILHNSLDAAARWVLIQNKPNKQWGIFLLNISIDFDKFSFSLLRSALNTLMTSFRPENKLLFFRLTSDYCSFCVNAEIIIEHSVCSTINLGKQSFSAFRCQLRKPMKLLAQLHYCCSAFCSRSPSYSFLHAKSLHVRINRVKFYSSNT